MKETSSLGRQLAAALAWRAGRKGRRSAAADLDPLRVSLWLKLLDRKNVELDDPLFPVAQMADGKNWSETWTGLAKQYEKEIAERDLYNHEKFVRIGDFGKELPPGWSADGLGLRAGPSSSGDFAVATEGYQAVAGIFPSGLFTNLLSDRMNGVLRSPLLPKDKKFISLQVLGGKIGAQRTIVDDCVIGEDHQILDAPDLKWITIPTKSDQQLPVYVELNTKSDNPATAGAAGEVQESDRRRPRVAALVLWNHPRLSSRRESDSQSRTGAHEAAAGKSPLLPNLDRVGPTIPESSIAMC